MKFILEPVNKTQLDKFIRRKDVTDILIGSDYLTCGVGLKLSVDLLNHYLNDDKKHKISLNINRLFHEDELESFQNYIKKINLENVKFIFYTDLGIYEILKSLGYQDKLIYDAHTYLTNANDVEIFSKLNKFVAISNQISTLEIEELLKKVSQKVVIHGFGKSIIFYSKRKLLTNYFKYRNFSYDPHKTNYSLKEEFRTDSYKIYEDEHGSYIYESGYYYLFEEFGSLTNVEYCLIHSTFLKQKEYEMIIDGYLTNDINKIKSLNIKISKSIMENKSVLLKNEVIDNE